MEHSDYEYELVSSSKLEGLIKGKKSFVLTGIERKSVGNAVSRVERMIEAAGMRCRVYTKGRVSTVAAMAVPSPVVPVGWLSAIGIGIHNLVTFNPDYEIAKNYVTGTLTVTYKK